jgi:carboxyl-terminal processing protease
MDRSTAPDAEPTPPPEGPAREPLDGGPSISELAAEPVTRSPTTAARSRKGTPWPALMLVAVLAGALLFGSGFALGHLAGSTPGTGAGEQQDFEAFWDAYHAISREYVGQADTKQLVEGAIKGMFGTLGDPFSSYLSSEDLKASLAGLSGQFEGIGAYMTTRATDGSLGCTPISTSCALVVDHPIAASPAARGGLLAGDQIVAVDGGDVAGKALTDVSKLIRGPRGTQVTLRLVRGTGAPFELTFTRDVVNEEAVETRLLANGKVGYIRLADFSADAAVEFTTKLKALLALGPRAIAFDLRGDPGGYVDAAQTIASQFLASGPVFWLAYADGREVPQTAQAGGIAVDPSIKVAVLVDKGSASASEIVAGALQDTGRATLVGSTSYGKGTIQQWYTLPNDTGGFRLSVAKWLTPVHKTWISGKGLTPDIAVATPANPVAGQDDVLDRAVQLLTGASATTTSVPGGAAAPGSVPLLDERLRPAA